MGKLRAGTVVLQQLLHNLRRPPRALPKISAPLGIGVFSHLALKTIQVLYFCQFLFQTFQGDRGICLGYYKGLWLLVGWELPFLSL